MVLASDLLEEILGQTPSASQLKHEGSEQREWPRFALGTRAAAARISGKVMGSAVKVLVRDISATGVSLLHPEPFERSERFLLSLPRKGKWGEGGNAAELHCTAVHCRAADSGNGLFIIGATFVSPPSQGLETENGESASSLLARIRQSILD